MEPEPLGSVLGFLSEKGESSRRPVDPLLLAPLRQVLHLKGSEGSRRRQISLAAACEAELIE